MSHAGRVGIGDVIFLSHRGFVGAARASSRARTSSPVARPRRVPRDGTACPPPTRSHLPARAVLSASMETDGDASETPPRVVRVWIKTDEDGRVASGARVCGRPLPASPEVSLVPGADGTPTDPDASAFDHAAYFDALKTRVYGRTLMTAGTLPSTQTLVQDNASAHPRLPPPRRRVRRRLAIGRSRPRRKPMDVSSRMSHVLPPRAPPGRTNPSLHTVRRDHGGRRRHPGGGRPGTRRRRGGRRGVPPRRGPNGGRSRQVAERPVLRRREDRRRPLRQHVRRRRIRRGGRSGNKPGQRRTDDVRESNHRRAGRARGRRVVVVDGDADGDSR